MSSWDMHENIGDNWYWHGPGINRGISSIYSLALLTTKLLALYSSNFVDSLWGERAFLGAKYLSSRDIVSVRFVQHAKTSHLDQVRLQDAQQNFLKVGQPFPCLKPLPSID